MWDPAGGHHAECEPEAVPLHLKPWVLAAGSHRSPVLAGGWEAVPPLPAVSHADLSHALTSSREREIMVWPFRPQSPPRAGRHRSSSPGRGPAAPRYLPQSAPLLGHPLALVLLLLPPTHGRARGAPAPGVCSPTHSPVSPQLLGSCLRLGHSLADKAGPGSGSSGEGRRGFRLRNNRMLAS